MVELDKNEAEKPQGGAKKWKLPLILAGIVILLAGAWFVAGQIASSKAEKNVNETLRAMGLEEFVRYDSVSVSPFGGGGAMRGVRLIMGPGEDVLIGSLRVEDVKTSDGKIEAAAFYFDDFVIPLKGAERHGGEDPAIQALVEMGYEEIKGDLSFSFAIDRAKRGFVWKTTATLRDMGGWDLDLRLGGLDPEIIDQLVLASGGKEALNPYIFMMLASRLGDRMTLERAALMLDNKAFIRRLKQAPPLENFRREGEILDRNALVYSLGVEPERAAAMEKDLQSWINDGGRLEIATRLENPILLKALFADGGRKSGGFYMSRFLGLTNAQVATK